MQLIIYTMYKILLKQYSEARETARELRGRGVSVTKLYFDRLNIAKFY